MENSLDEDTLLLRYPDDEELAQAKRGEIPLTCYAAIKLLHPTATQQTLIQLAKNLENYFSKCNNNFAEFVAKYYFCLETLCKSLKRRLIIIRTNKHRTNSLMHDSHLIFLSRWPLHCWIFDVSGCLNMWVRKTDQLP